MRILLLFIMNLKLFFINFLNFSGRNEVKIFIQCSVIARHKFFWITLPLFAVTWRFLWTRYLIFWYNQLLYLICRRWALMKFFIRFCVTVELLIWGFFNLRLSIKLHYMPVALNLLTLQHCPCTPFYHHIFLSSC